MLSSALRGSGSVAIRKDITTAINCLVERLKDVYGMSDHKTLISIYPINNINQGFSLMALDHAKFLLDRISSPRQTTAIRRTRSNALPSSMVAPPLPNQTPRGLLVTSKNQMVGIHKDKDASGNCLRSSRRRNSTNIAQSMSATLGGIGSKKSGKSYLRGCGRHHHCHYVA